MSFVEIIGPGRFASGKLTYTDHFMGDHRRNTRIVIPVEFGSSIFTTAIVDTGALWCILNLEEAKNLDVAYLDALSSDSVSLRGSSYQGVLYRMPITIHAEQGSDLTVEGTVFVPKLRVGELWPHPNFLGLDGFLHRLRFGVDPQENAFYFGFLL